MFLWLREARVIIRGVKEFDLGVGRKEIEEGCDGFDPFLYKQVRCIIK